ncbi:hypothetical protein HPB50_023074 [Hyalomma asiaticum]|uniref:Uncharacterized protein n=1 Tax=Hyalomma asiaticum TaxID=266040 RepID=A0ACB7T629_HYAAI|nr:hypothetical protein HPB50_023074 [Hyalomma asiaticum]
MLKVTPLLEEQLPPHPAGQGFSSQLRRGDRPPDLETPQQPAPRPSTDGQLQLPLYPEQEAPQPQFGEQPYPRLKTHRQSAPPDEQDLGPDSQYSWTVAGAAAWNIFCCSLLRRGMPVLFHAVGETFSTTAKGSVAWTNAFIYSLAYTLFPVTMALCRTMPLRLLSVVGALLIGVGQIACFVLGSLSLMVPTIAVSCGLGAAFSSVVDETTLYLHFESQRQLASHLYQAAFSLSAILYPLVLLFLLESYGLNGTLLVSGAISLNALIGSVFMSRPMWMSPSAPLPPIYRPEVSQVTASAAVQPAAQAREVTAKEDVNQEQEIMESIPTTRWPKRRRQTPQVFHQKSPQVLHLAQHRWNLGNRYLLEETPSRNHARLPAAEEDCPIPLRRQ